MNSNTVQTPRLSGHTIFYYWSFIALGLACAAIGPTLPTLAGQTHSQLKQISFLFITLSLGYFLGSLVSGRLYDRIKGHHLMVAGLAIMFLLLLVVPLSSTLLLLTALLFFVGIAEAFVDVGGNTLIVWLYGQNVGLFMNGLHFFFGLGTFLSPLLVAASLKLGGGIVGSYWVLATMALPALFGLLKLPSPAAPQAAQGEKKIQRVYFPLLGFSLLFFCLIVAYEGSYGSWIYTYAVKTGLADQFSAAYLTSAYWGAFTVGRLLSVPLAHWLRPKTILLGNLLGSLVSVIVLLLFPQSALVLWIGSAGLGLCVAPLFATTLTFLSSHIPLSGRITSLVLASSSISGMFFPWLIGQMLDTVGTRSMMPFFVGLVGAAALVLLVLIYYSRKTPQV